MQVVFEVLHAVQQATVAQRVITGKESRKYEGTQPCPKNRQVQKISDLAS